MKDFKFVKYLESSRNCGNKGLDLECPICDECGHTISLYNKKTLFFAEKREGHFLFKEKSYFVWTL